MRSTITLCRQNAELLILKWVAHIFNTVHALEVTTCQLYDLTIYGLRKLNVLFCLMFHDFKNSIVLSKCLFFWQEQKEDEDEYKAFVQWHWQEKVKVLRKIHIPLSLSLHIAHANICRGLWIFKCPLKSEPLEKLKLISTISSLLTHSLASFQMHILCGTKWKQWSLSFRII
jgi:hypothetical protein